MPSTTNSGWALPDSDLMPRMRMYDDAPGAPELDTICTFGAFAASALTMFDSLLCEIAAESTVLITVPSFSRVVAVPAPVITTSPSCSGFAISVKSCVIDPGLSVTWSVRSLYPMMRTDTRDGLPADASGWHVQRILAALAHDCAEAEFRDRHRGARQRVARFTADMTCDGGVLLLGGDNRRERGTARGAEQP